MQTEFFFLKPKYLQSIQRFTNEKFLGKNQASQFLYTMASQDGLLSSSVAIVMHSINVSHSVYCKTFSIDMCSSLRFLELSCLSTFVLVIYLFLPESYSEKSPKKGIFLNISSMELMDRRKHHWCNSEMLKGKWPYDNNNLRRGYQTWYFLGLNSNMAAATVSYCMQIPWNWLGG